MFAGKLVRQLREAKGISPTVFAASVGVSERQMSRYEAGEMEPRYSVALRMARVLGVPLDDLHAQDATEAAPAAPLSDDTGPVTTAARR